MAADTERLSQEEEARMRQMDTEDRTAMRLCLLSAGALAGLAIQGSVARRLAVLGCTFLTAGLAIPLVKEYLDTREQDGAAGEPLRGEGGE